MRLLGLLALLLFVIVFFAAPAASFAQSADTPAAVPDSPKADSGVIAPDRPNPTPETTDRAVYAKQPLMEHGGDLVFRETEENDDLCYSLRTYVMARDDKSSDATHLARKIKCTPARKFGIKSADIRIEEPAANKFKVK